MIRTLGRVFVQQSLRMAFLLLVVSMISFALLALSPIDPIDAYFGGNVMSEEQKAVVEAYWQYDKPPIERYMHWIGNVVQGDWGESLIYREPVLTVIQSKFQETFILLIASWILSGALGFTLGVMSGTKANTWVDYLIRGYSYFCASAPVFWIGLLVLIIFSVELRWFPFALATPIGKDVAYVTWGDRLYHMVLPVITLSLSVAGLTLHTRKKTMQVLETNYMLFAKARGEGLWERVKNHGLRNVLIPFITIQFAAFSKLFSGTILVETVFSYPGLGRTVTLAGLRGDVSLLLGVALISALFVCVGNMIANLLYVIINPQMKEEVRH